MCIYIYIYIYILYVCVHRWIYECNRRTSVTLQVHFLKASLSNNVLFGKEHCMLQFNTFPQGVSESKLVI